MRRVDIDDVRTVAKALPHFLDCAFNVINGQIAAEHVVQGDENDIIFRQSVIVSSLSERQMTVHQTAVIPCPLGNGAFVGGLDFDVIPPAAAVDGESVERDRMSPEIFDGILRLAVDDVQVGFVQNDSENQFRQLRLFVKTDRKKRVVNEAELSDHGAVFRPYLTEFFLGHFIPVFLLFAGQRHHPLSLLLL